MGSEWLGGIEDQVAIVILSVAKNQFGHVGVEGQGNGKGSDSSLRSE